MHGSEAKRGLFGGWEVLRAGGGEMIRVEDTPAALIVIVDDARGEEVARVSVERPRAGYGGHELVLSADERYLAMWLHSGQSQVGYELFTFRPALRRLHSFPYVFGEGTVPVFSADEKRIVLAWATDPTLCLEGNDPGDGVLEKECVVEWAQVHLRDLPDGGERRCAISVRLPTGFPCEGDDSYHPEHLAVTGDAITFDTTWGVAVRIPLPPADSVVIAGPSRR